MSTIGNFVFHQDTSEISNGNELITPVYSYQENMILGLDIAPVNCTELVIVFEATGLNDNYVPYLAYDMSDGSSKNTSNSIVNKLYQVDLVGTVKFRVRVTTINEGGTVTIKGKISD